MFACVSDPYFSILAVQWCGSTRYSAEFDQTQQVCFTSHNLGPLKTPLFSIPGKPRLHKLAKISLLGAFAEGLPDIQLPLVSSIRFNKLPYISLDGMIIVLRTTDEL